MSNSTENRSSDRGNRNSGRNRNQGGNRNRSNNGRNGRQGGGGPRKRQGGGDRDYSPSDKHRAETPIAQPLTFWQKILKAIGLFKEPVAPRGRRPQKKFDEQKQARKSNTRVAKGGNREHSERSERPERKPRQVPNPDKVTGTRLYIGNLSFDASESDLEELFKGAGKVRGVDIVYNRATHRSKGYGFVEMNHLDEAKRAVEVLHDQPFMGRTLIVNEANSKGPADGSDDENDSDNDASSTDQDDIEVVNDSDERQN